MTTATQSLTSWLLDKIAEDEAVARAASPGPWRHFGGGRRNDVVVAARSGRCEG